MKLKYLRWVVAPLLLGLGAYGIRSGAVARSYAIWTKAYPVIELPEVLELGEHELNEVVLPAVVISNRGGGDLVVDQISSNCACSGLVRRTGDQLERVDSIRLGPGQHAELAMRISVRGVIGNSARFGVHFHTNDPTRSEASLVAVVSKITGGLVTDPKTITFPVLCAGTEARKVVNLIDTAVRPRSVIKVASSDPNRLHARLLPAEVASEINDTDSAGPIIGRLEITVPAMQPGTVDASVLVFLDDPLREPDVIPVTARILRGVEASPPLLTLPRASGAGLLYDGECVCRSTAGLPLSLDLDSALPGVSVTVIAAERGASIRRVRIECKKEVVAASRVGGQDSGLSVRLRARVGDSESILAIPVHVSE